MKRNALALLGLVVLAGCGADATNDAIRLPTPNAGLDYQLGGSYAPPDGAGVLARDRTESPAVDRYNICYVNGFQTQPDETGRWLEEHPNLLLSDTAGEPVVDPEFPDERIIDTSTRQRRDELLEIVGPWIDGCAEAGFDAVEIDNLDTFARFADRLTEQAAVHFARALADRAHRNGLAIGQKNSTELVDRRNETTFDFAIVEQCNEYDECDVFTEGYGDQVYVIEYDRGAFDRGCVDYPQLAIVFRDVELAAPGAPSYVRDAC